jgi:hypothetical protein
MVTRSKWVPFAMTRIGWRWLRRWRDIDHHDRKPHTAIQGSTFGPLRIKQLGGKCGPEHRWCGGFRGIQGTRRRDLMS